MIVHAQDVQQRRFTGAGWTHHGNEVPFADFQVDVAQDVKKLLLRQEIRAFETFKFDHTFTRSVMLALDRPASRVARATMWQ